ncbi:hypothetical protein AYX15_07107 [Cryptococcus neoformans]|nr:hypothetical protein AYX15_07107 [Cryptococcus neoformans var. grubii]
MLGTDEINANVKEFCLGYWEGVKATCWLDRKSFGNLACWTRFDKFTNVVLHPWPEVAAPSHL